MRSRAGFVGSAAGMLNYFSVAATVAMGSIFVNGVASRLRAVLSMLRVTHVGSGRLSGAGNATAQKSCKKTNRQTDRQTDTQTNKTNIR